MLLFLDGWFSFPVFFTTLGAVLVMLVAVVVVTLIGLMIYFVVRKEDYVIEEITIIETEDGKQRRIVDPEVPVKKEKKKKEKKKKEKKENKKEKNRN